jgi:hypothetical protein
MSARRGLPAIPPGFERVAVVSTAPEQLVASLTRRMSHSVQGCHVGKPGHAALVVEYL